MQGRYADFDYTALEGNQLRWIKHLSVFSKYRQRIVSKFSPKDISNDEKIMFLDQHSMRLGNNIFYTLEHARLEYLQAGENHPLFAFLLSAGFFFRFARRAPMHSKLYKELLLSIIYGSTLTYTVNYYYYLKYIDVVNECYSIVKEKFDQASPALAAKIRKEGEMSSLIKNFGTSPWNHPEVDDENDLLLLEEDIFEGTVEDERKERVDEVMDRLYN